MYFAFFLPAYLLQKKRHISRMFIILFLCKILVVWLFLRLQVKHFDLRKLSTSHSLFTLYVHT